MSSNNQDFSILKSLYDFMLSKYLPCNRDINLDGTIKRYCKDNSKKKDEWYVGSFVNELHYWCVFGSWTTGEKFKFCSWNDRSEISEEDYERYRKGIEEAEKQRENDVKNTLKDLKRDYPNLPKTTEHPYLKRKGIDVPVAIDRERIIFPVYNKDGELQTCQAIDTEGNKRFYTGLPFSGGRIVFGKLEKKVEAFICEGVATAYSLFKATGKAVVAAYSCSNIPCVAAQLKEEGYKLIHAQDLGDAGDRTAKELERLNIASVKPKFKNPTPSLNDFNDLAIAEGFEAVKACFCEPLASMLLIDLFESDLPPIEWYIEDYVSKGSVNLIWADSGLGKSTFCYAMAMHAAAGKPFLMKKISGRLKTLYIDGEMSKIEIKQKALMIHKAMQLDDEEQPADDSLHTINFEMWEDTYSDIIDLYSPTTRARLDRHFEEIKPELIFLDNFSSLTGLGNEDGYSNKEEAWKQIHHWVKSITRKGMSVVVIHHANGRGSLYGTTAIRRSVSTEIELRESESNKEYELMFELHYKKARHIKGMARAPKLVHFDNDEKCLIYKPSHNSEKFWKISSHWISVPLNKEQK